MRSPVRRERRHEPVRSGWLALALASAALVACVETTSGRAEPAIASAWRSRCGTCHMRVEPGTHTRAQLEAAAGRHRVRTRLDDAQWKELVDFLAQDTAPKTALR